MDAVRQLDLPSGHEVGLGHPRLTSSSHLGVKKYTDLKNYCTMKNVQLLHCKKVKKILHSSGIWPYSTYDG
jgi:hypothetical protein